MSHAQRPLLTLVALLAATALLVRAQEAGPVSSDAGGSQDAVSPVEEPLFFIARETWPNQREVGLVTLGPWEVMRISSELGALSPYERALIAAKRLNDFVEDYGSDEPIRQVTIQGYEVIQGGTINIITVDDATARDNGSSSAQLADRWCVSLREALRLGGHRVVPAPAPDDELSAVGFRPLPSHTDGAPTAIATAPMAPGPAEVGPVDLGAGLAPIPREGVAQQGPTEAVEQPAGGYAEATVPLVDARGASIGRAVVAGPAEAVARVERVVQLSEKVGAAELRALAPCAETPRGEPLLRVPGVYVAGLATTLAAEGGG